MNFSISSNTLLSQLQNSGKVIASKTTMPILDHFLFDLKDGILKITASDMETTLVATVEVASSQEDGAVAVPAKRIQDSLKELSEQPITISVNQETFEITITWASGNLTLPGLSSAGYPETSTIAEASANQLSLESEWLLAGINKSVFATADSDIRPTMNGIFFDITPSSLTFVATDAHKLVKVTMNSALEIEEPASFILPKRAAHLLKGLLSKQDEPVSIMFDPKSIIFSFGGYTLTCRPIEGRYPNYNSVIPKNNANKVTADRIALLNAIRRVSVCSSQASNLIKLSFSADNIALTAQDVNFAVAANDTIECVYDGAPISMGFKSTFLIEILSTMSSKEIIIELSDATRAGLFIPAESSDHTESDMLMLLMPIIS